MYLDAAMILMNHSLHPKIILDMSAKLMTAQQNSALEKRAAVLTSESQRATFSEE